MGKKEFDADMSIPPEADLYRSGIHLFMTWDQGTEIITYRPLCG